MKVIQRLDFQLSRTVVCIGKFDGIHRGHQRLLAEAKKEGLPVVMFSFASVGRVLYTQEEKTALAQKLGVDILVEVPLDGRFMKQSPEEFVTEILIKKCDAKKVVVGSDFRFGYQRQGDVQILSALGEAYGFEVVVCEKLVDAGAVISSTRIRSLVEEGKIRDANRLLGTPYFLSGVVAPGNRIGRSLDAPTANIAPGEDKLLPPYGVYATVAEVEGKCFDGVCNLGVKPTISGDNPVGLEVWLFDYEGDLYGKRFTAQLLDYLRPEWRFRSLSELKDQIREDSIQARKILSEMK